VTEKLCGRHKSHAGKCPICIWWISKGRKCLFRRIF